MNWTAPLEVHPIVTRTGKTLRTLNDARSYLLDLPETPETIAAAGELLKAAEHGGPFLMTARIMVALAVGVKAKPVVRRKTWREKRMAKSRAGIQTKAR